jgi:D-alanyl-D-alanine carboxypeptidase/D-alanyl-D-alanine-endopeptidase (penicillin-binding protein 4)
VAADGTLQGDLVLVGGGDPFLDTGALDGLAARLAAQGIRRVAGRLLFDAGWLPLLPEISASQPIAAHYNPGVSALSVNFNRVHARWTLAGGTVTARALAVSDAGEMPADWIVFSPAPAGTAAGIGFLLQPVGDRDGWAVSPSLAEPGALWLPVRNAAWHTASLFARLLEGRGIAVPAPQPGPAPAGARPLAEHSSVPLVEVAELVLHYSNNLSAELMGLAAARAVGANPGSLAESAAVMADWFRRQMPGADWAGFAPGNHSGLSVRSRASPRHMAQVLAYAWPRQYAGRPFASLLKTVGFQAEINEPLPGDPVQIRAKTGTMYYGRGLAGYLTGAGGRQAGFAVFVSDLAARAAADAALDRRFVTGPPGASGWLARAREAEKALVADWARAL